VAPAADTGRDMTDWYDAYWRRDELATAGDADAPTRLGILRSLLPAGERPLRILDAGCGHGDLVAALRADGADASGMDISTEAVSQATRLHPGCAFLAHSVEETPWPQESASLDVVVAFEVIEHLMRPSRLLEGAHAALRPGGQLALTTPYHGRAKNVALALAGFDRHFAVEGDHIRFFTDDALRRLLERHGFALERLVHYGRLPLLWRGVFAWARKR
jgi:2-polyprenyl-3-methyl-5-hydroxy-6-metoxy-1,4-benzoquinol methylase